MLFLVLTRLGRCNFRTTARGTTALYAHGCRDASALFVLWRGMPEGDAMLCKLRMPARGSVVLVPTDSPDVVPCIGLVAEEALRDVRVLDPCDRHRDHVKVPHVMAGRGLVALGAVHGERRGVAELGDVPGTRGVTRGAVAPEEGAVWILVRVAGRTVDGHLFRLYPRVRDWQGGELDLGIHPDFLCTDTSEHDMVHGDRTVRNAHMLDVATSTRTDGRVERGRLVGEERLVVGVADDALISRDTRVWCVAGLAGGGQELVLGREGARVDHGLPARDRCGAAFTREVRHGDADGQGPECDESIDDLDALHRSHRMPKYHTDQMCSARSMYRRREMMIWQASQLLKACLNISCVFTAYSRSAMDSESWSARTAARMGWAATSPWPTRNEAVRRRKKPANGRRVAACPAS